ncbi:MAG: VTT domain-containing protein [Kiritimatiellaeota bacterium]|nr:VTT domain-containing protein [Kiritimatiellota bacterium]
MKRLLQFSAFALLAMMLLFWLAHSMGWLQDAAIQERLQSLRGSDGGQILVVSAVVVLLAADLFLPVPSSIVMTASGSLIGNFALAFLANLLGSLACALWGYALCHRFGRPFLLRATTPGDLARAEKFWDRYGGWGIVLCRALPMFPQIISCLAGFLRMNFGAFIGLTLLGAVPLSAFYAWAGQHGMASGGSWAFLLALAVSGLGFLALEVWKKR